MRHVNSYDPDIFLMKSGSNWYFLVALPFLIIGISIIVIPMVQEQKIEAPVRIVMMFMGSIFTLVGFLIALGRSSIAIDRRMKTIQKAYSLVIPFKMGLYKLEDYNRVTLIKEVRNTGKSTTSYFVIRLVGKKDPLNITEALTYEDQRRLAESIGKFTNYEVADSTSGKEIVRSADLLDESIREKIRRTGKVIEIPEAPINTKIEYSLTENEFIANMPSGLGEKIAFLLPVLIFTIILGTMLPGLAIVLLKGSGTNIQFGFWGAIAIIAAFLVREVIKALAMRIELVVTPKKLEKVEVWKQKRKSKHIDADKLEELDLLLGGPMAIASMKGDIEGKRKTEEGQEVTDTEMPKIPVMPDILKWLLPNEIIARSDDLTLKFGNGLSTEELKWMHAVIEDMVSK